MTGIAVTHRSQNWGLTLIYPDISSFVPDALLAPVGLLLCGITDVKNCVPKTEQTAEKGMKILPRFVRTRILRLSCMASW